MLPGDTAVIHKGIYREWISPARSGSSSAPIEFQGAVGQTVVLTGANLISGWVPAQGHVWKKEPWPYRFAIHPNDRRHRLIGRCEQLIVDGRLLKQVERIDDLAEGSFCVDIDVRDVLVEECLAMDNARHGVYVEISGGFTIRNNLCAHNGTEDHWGSGGISLGESDHCIIENNTCVLNPTGISLREQGPRTCRSLDGGQATYHVHDVTVRKNICAYNSRYQLGLWWDNPFFGLHPTASRGSLGTSYDPDENDIRTDLGRYLVAIVRDVDLKSPELTGQWEAKLRDIEAGRADRDVYFAHRADGPVEDELRHEAGFFRRLSMITQLCGYIPSARSLCDLSRLMHRIGERLLAIHMLA